MSDQPPEHRRQNTSVAGMRMWDDLGLLLVVSQVGSFAKAEDILGINQATIGRRLAQLESKLGVELVRRSTQGVVLTEVGKSIAHEAGQMEHHANIIHRIAQGDHKSSHKTVNLALSDGIAKYLLTPFAEELRNKSPSTFIAFNCTHVPADIEKNHADIVIGYQVYSSFDIVNATLGWIHLYPFASPQYLKKHGRPKTIEELKEHTLVDHLADGIDEGDWGLWRAIEPVGVPFSANLSSVHFELIRAGVGIGLLPNYGLEKRGVEFVDLDFKITIPMYLSYPRRLRTNPDIRAVVSWIRWVFENKHGKWLKEDFSAREYVKSST